MRNLHETHDDLQLAQKNPESEEIKEKRVTYQQEKKKSSIIAEAVNEASENLGKIKKKLKIVEESSGTAPFFF